MDGTAGWDATLRLRSWERARLGLAHGERLLDVGCGLGEAALGLAQDLGQRGRSSASTRRRGCCASPVRTPEPHVVACASPSAMRAPSTSPTRPSTPCGPNARSSGSPTPQPRSPRWCGWCAPAAGLADRHRLVDVHDRCRRRRTRGPGPRPDADGARSALQRRPAAARPRRRGRLRSAREDRGDADLDDLGPGRVAGTAWLFLDGEPRGRPRRRTSAHDRRWPTIRVDDPRRRATRSVLDAPHDVRGRGGSPVVIGWA